MLTCKNDRTFDKAPDMRKKPRESMIYEAYQEDERGDFRIWGASRERGRDPAEPCLELIRTSRRRLCPYVRMCGCFVEIMMIGNNDDNDGPHGFESESVGVLRNGPVM